MSTTRPSLRDLVRLARTPRWLGLLALAVAVAVGAGVLGMWQWGRTQDILAAERASRAAPADIRELVTPADLPSESIGRRALLAGEYDVRGQLLVRDRACPHPDDDNATGSDGTETSTNATGATGATDMTGATAGFWVLTPLVLDDGSVAGVLRGCVSDPADPAVVLPTGTVHVEGVLHPEEKFYADAAPVDGVGLAVRTSDAGWDGLGTVLPGFVMLTATDAAGPQPMPVAPTVQTGDVGFPLQNFFYAVQWWIFAAFGFVAWARWLWVEASESVRERGAVPSAA